MGDITPYARLAGVYDELVVDPCYSDWADFLDGLVTIAGSCEPAAQTGLAVHVYRANRSMGARCFYDADGELMLVPQQGALMLFTELGKLEVAPGEIAVIPRGMKFRVDLAGPSTADVADHELKRAVCSR